MADNKLLSQMLEHLVNEESAKAEELFHEYVVAKSREIYEELLESDLKERKFYLLDAFAGVKSSSVKEITDT